MVTRAPLLVLAMVFASGTLWSQQDPLEKLAGTWKQDFSKTTPVPSPLPQSRTHRWEMAGKDKMKHVSETVSANGERTVTEEQADDYSGKPYPDGEEGQTTVFRRIDSNTIQQIRTGKNGQIVRFLERVISPDGKTLTIRQIAVDAQGRGSQAIQVYHKQ
jgi:uncharacterized GH25 family protein